MSLTTAFTEKLDIMLIRNVKENPVLYDHNHTRYMDYNEREVIWQKIGDELHRPAAECKARWVNIRDIYRRKLRKQILSPAQCKKKNYKYEKEISFLKSFYREVVPHPISGFSDDPIDYDDIDNPDRDDHEMDDPGYSNDHIDESEEDEKPIIKKYKRKSSSSAKKKAKRARRELEVVSPVIPSSSVDAAPSISADFDTSDPVDAFLLSIGATLRSFSPYRLNLAKSQIFSVVQEHDLKQIVEKQSQNINQNQSDVKLCNMDYGNV